MVIQQGEVYWLQFGRERGSEPAGRRPALVVQHDRFNRSALATTVVAAITSSLRMAQMPGNVRLPKGEAGLPKPSVVNVSQLAMVDKVRLTEKLGQLGARRMSMVLQGLNLLLGTGERTDEQ